MLLEYRPACFPCGAAGITEIGSPKAEENRMKFTDGYWKVRQNMAVYNASAAKEIETEENAVNVYAPGIPASESGKALGGVTIRARYSSPTENVIRVELSHFEGSLKTHPSFVDARNGKAEVKNGPDCVSLVSGQLSVRIRKGNGWDVEYSYTGRRLTGSGWRSTGYCLSDGGNAYMKEELALGVGEAVYGLGERFTAFVKNGQVVDIWNADGGTSSELAYKNIPFYVTSKAYGVLVNDSGAVSFEVASEKVERVQFSTKGEYLEYYIIGGEDIADVIRNYTALTGRPALPPAWSFGLWLTTSFTTDYDEKTVNSFIRGMKERDIPLEVFHFDCFWMKGGHWCDFEWDQNVFPDPGAMLKRLKAEGLKICVWINPYIAQRSRLFREGVENGYFIKTDDGGVWQGDEWQPGMAIVDFTNPGACRWYAGELKRLVDMGVDTFKTDFGERIPHKNVRYFDNADPEHMHNYYTFLYNKTVFETLEEAYGRNRALVFARSATAGGQKFPVHWGGDCSASYESMAESLRGGLSLSLCGFGFWSHDMGGFENCATPDLYKRWVAFGMLSSHSRLHGNSSYRVPWLFDEEAVEVLRFFAKLKCSLMPYIYAMAHKAGDSGIPVMRPMIMAFPDDPACIYLDRQYMLGDSLLVAPVFEENGTVEYYLPKGRWTNLLSNEVVSESGWKDEKHGYRSLPLMVRENSVLPMGRNDRTPVYDYTEGVVFHIFELKEEGKAEAVIHTKDNDRLLRVTVARAGERISVWFDGGYENCRLMLRNIGKVAGVTNGEQVSDAQGTIILPSGGARSILIDL